MSELFINPKRIPDAMLPKGWVFDKELSNYSDIDFTKNFNFVYSNDDHDLMLMVACDACDDDFGISVDVGRTPLYFTQIMKTKSPDTANGIALDYMKCCKFT
jgi:hypothetical protein